MEKPTAVVAEMYELFGVEVRPKYGDRGSSTSATEHLKEENDDEDASIIQLPVSDEDDSEEEDISIEIPASYLKKLNGLKTAPLRFEAVTASGQGSSSIFEPGLTIRDRKRVREEGKLPTILKIAERPY